jgi:hypothetical protein
MIANALEQEPLPMEDNTLMPGITVRQQKNPIRESLRYEEPRSKRHYPRGQFGTIESSTSFNGDPHARQERC